MLDRTSPSLLSFALSTGSSKPSQTPTLNRPRHSQQMLKVALVIVLIEGAETAATTYLAVSLL